MLFVSFVSFLFKFSLGHSHISTTTSPRSRRQSVYLQKNFGSQYRSSERRVNDDRCRE